MKLIKLKNIMKRNWKRNFCNIFNLMLINYRECQSHISKTMKNEENQKALNASLNYLKKKTN
jgi:hypothetical protein